MLHVSVSRNNLSTYSRYEEFVAYFEDNIPIEDPFIIKIIIAVHGPNNYYTQTVDFWFGDTTLWTKMLCSLYTM